MNLARSYAALAHAEAGKFYDGKPYLVHLDRVLMYVHKYCDIYPPKYLSDLQNAAYLHDVLEDCPVITFNMLAGNFGRSVAEVVKALTNTGARANAEYYKQIEGFPAAVFIKICDRLANVSYSLENKNFEKLAMYYAENTRFIAGVGANQYPIFKTMLLELKGLFNRYKILSNN